MNRGRHRSTLRYRLTILLGAVCLAAVTGCTAPAVKDLKSWAVDLPRTAKVSSVPFFPQTKDYCGPSALAMTLAWSGLEATPAAVARSVFTPAREGTLKTDILGGARRHGRLAVRVSRLHDVLRELAAGNPVLVFQNLALDIAPQWHFAVATGYDLDGGTITLHSGTRRDLKSSLNTFAHTWARGGNWAVTITPPGKLPATAEEVPALRAAVGLERAGHAAAAARAYQAIVSRWPESFGAAMGLGNANYATKNYVSATEAFASATTLRPRSAAAWNNLAHAMAALGRRNRAIYAARRAVTLGGKSSPTYRATLSEVSTQRP